MGYIICNKCGGYYELQEGESPKDFEACHCGGNLRYVESIKEVYKPKNRLKCGVCGHEQEKGLKCSKCASNLRIKTNQNSLNYKNNYRNKLDYRHVLEGSSEINVFDRIQWNGVISGVVFYIVARIIMYIVGIILFMGAGLATAQNTATISIMGVISLLLGLINALIPIGSGFWAVYQISTRDYLTAIMTGSMVGIVLGIFFGLISMIFGLVAFGFISGYYEQVNVNSTIISMFFGLIIGIIYAGVTTGLGGLIAVYVRKHTNYLD